MMSFYPRWINQKKAIPVRVEQRATNVSKTAHAMSPSDPPPLPFTRPLFPAFSRTDTTSKKDKKARDRD